jgi:hypothetical protein
MIHYNSTLSKDQSYDEIYYCPRCGFDWCECCTECSVCLKKNDEYLCKITLKIHCLYISY